MKHRGNTARYTDASWGGQGGFIGSMEGRLNWLKAQVESEEYTSKSDVVNDLIRKARARQSEIEWIRAKLIRAEQSGFTDKTKDRWEQYKI